jgi:hypothetical protein
MSGAIERLARALEKDWSRLGAAGNFAEVAERHLSGPLDLDVGVLIGNLGSSLSLPPQRLLDQSFGQPQVTLYCGDAFQIEVLFWHTGTPAIHQHAFEGAFRLLAGRSAHSRYRFEPKARIGRVTVGRLDMAQFELLRAGSTARIPRGAGLIHSAFHLDSPTVTLVVRTEQHQAPELTYLPPGVAYDTADRGAALHKKLQLLDMLAVTAHPGYAATVAAAIAAGDLYDGLAVLIRTGSHSIGDSTFRGFAEKLRMRHSDCGEIETVINAGYAERRRIRLVRSRHSMVDADSRFFLGAMLCFTDRAALLDALTRYAGNVEAACDLIATGVGRLFVGNGDREILARAAANVRLRGGPARSFVETVAAMRSGDLANEEEKDLIRFYRQLTGHWLLSPLFDEPNDAVGAAF